MISPINTAVRWYTDIFESDRFSSDCDIERFELISDKTRLLPFQFRRPKNPYPISRWFLRKYCVNTVEPLLEANDSLFTYNTGFWTKLKFGFLNGKIRTTGGASPSNLRKFGIFTVGKYYDITIVVNEFIKLPLSSFAVTHDIAGNGVVAITGTGTIKIKILATTADFSIDVVGGTSADSITIESVKINEYQVFDTGLGDIDLDLTLLSLINLNTTSDLIQYCGNSLPIQIPCGKYYMVITYDTSEIVYSELITVKDFIPSQSPFTIIEWTNSCDISDIIYQPINGCQFTNRMYIESELSKIEYPFKEEGEEDGNYKLNLTFQKWEKISHLIVAKCPEFIVDALTGIRLHDTISITKSLRKNQYEVLPSFEIESVEYENTSVFVDCATNVDLKLLLKDKVVDSTCCTNTAIPACYTCDYTVDDVDVLTDDIYYGTPPSLDYGLYRLVEGDYIAITTLDVVVCITATGLKHINLGGEYWTEVPFIGVVNEAVVGPETVYTVSGYIYPNSYATISAQIYDASTSTYTTINYPTPYVQSNLSAGVEIGSSTFGVPIPTDGAVSFYVNNYSIGCEYGTSQLFNIFYPALHTVVQDWYDAMVVRPMTDTTIAFDKFIKGLETDGILAEFDLLHVLAGLDTTQQRVTPLISTSGNKFIVAGTPTFDNSGFNGGGWPSYLNLSWIASVDGVKFLQDDASMGAYINNDVQEDAYDLGSKSPGINSGFISRTLLDVFVGKLNNDIIVSAANTSSIGLFSIAFDGTTRTIYKDGVSVSTSVSASTGVSTFSQYLGARNNEGIADGQTARTYQLVFIGSKLIDHADLSARFATLKASLAF